MRLTPIALPLAIAARDHGERRLRPAARRPDRSALDGAAPAGPGAERRRAAIDEATDLLETRARGRSAQPRRLYRARPGRPRASNCRARRSVLFAKRCGWSPTTSTRSPARARPMVQRGAVERARQQSGADPDACATALPAGDAARRRDRQGPAAPRSSPPQRPDRAPPPRPQFGAATAEPPREGDEVLDAQAFPPAARGSMPSAASASSAPARPFRLWRSILRRWPKAAAVSALERRRASTPSGAARRARCGRPPTSPWAAARRRSGGPSSRSARRCATGRARRGGRRRRCRASATIRSATSCWNIRVSEAHQGGQASPPSQRTSRAVPTL